MNDMSYKSSLDGFDLKIWMCMCIYVCMCIHLKNYVILKFFMDWEVTFIIVKKPFFLTSDLIYN